MNFSKEIWFGLGSETDVKSEGLKNDSLRNVAWKSSLWSAMISSRG